MQILTLNLAENTQSLDEVPTQVSVEAEIEFGRAASEGGLTVVMGTDLQPEDGKTQPGYRLFAHDGTVYDHNLA